MRLTIINQFYSPDISPTAHLAASLAEHRAARGDLVSVVTSYGGYVSSSRKPDGNPHPYLSIYRIWTPQLSKRNKLFRLIDYAVFYLFTLKRMLLLPAQDIIISLTTPPFIAWTGLLHKMLNHSTRLILWNMDCYPEVAERTGVIQPGGMTSRIMRMLNRLLLRRLDGLICLDQAMANLLTSGYGLEGKRPKIAVVPNWERRFMFPSARTSTHGTDTKESSLPGYFLILYLGNLGYGHDFETVLDVAAQLRHERVRFLFVGGGARWSALAEGVAKRGLSNIILRDYVPKEATPQVMASAECALITLRKDMLGTMSPSKLHGYLAMGIPVIYVGPVGSNVDVAIRRFGCGISLRNGQIQAMVEFIREMNADRRYHRQLRHYAREAFETAYSDVQTLPLFDAVIQEVVGGDH